MRTLLSIIALCLALSACGIKGPLELPAQNARPADHPAAASQPGSR